ncbi:MAG TPA: pyridoxal 5'-phosphate synthase glutaminase subunit PdxT [Chloroflexota bacterium]|nr:pyridoxal 5'-phosphate synthase glutaminase subunit PdxT [Chloroflexota bacterium]
MRIGVLALQGDFREHLQALRGIGVDAQEVRLPRDLARVDGLIIPGGESTTIGKLLVAFDLMEDVRKRALDGFPVYGTCAGAIVLSSDVRGSGVDQPVVGVMDTTIQRNAFGRQVDSFEVDLPIAVLGEQPFHAVFIRAPVIERIGPGVNPLARLSDGTVVAVQQGNLVATAFHPELTRDGRFHRYFAELVERCL